MEHNYEYDVCLSFAGSDRAVASEVASILKANNIRVFYDEYEKVKLLGENLYTYLDEIYRLKSRYAVMFISEDYIKKVYTNHERAAIQARAIVENKAYILPFRLDNTNVPGLLDTIAYASITTTSPEEFAYLVIQKVAFAYNLNIRANQRKRNHEDLIYDFSKDITLRQWVPMYSDTYKFIGVEMKYYPEQNYRLWAKAREAVGVNLMGLPPSGRIEFRYSPIHCNQTNDNLIIYIIPLKSPINSFPIELGAERPLEQDNAFSTYRIKYICKGTDNEWGKASIDYDFTDYGEVSYVIFAPRINEGCHYPGPGELLISGVKVYSTCSLFPEFWVPNNYTHYQEARIINGSYRPNSQ